MDTIYDMSSRSVSSLSLPSTDEEDDCSDMHWSTDRGSDLSDSSLSFSDHNESECEEDSESESSLADSSSSFSENGEDELESRSGVRDTVLGSIDSCFLEPLYPGADLSIFESYLLLLQFSLRHSLTKKAFEELLCLIGSHLPPNAKAATSLHKLKKLFLEIFPEVHTETHYFCANCHQLLVGAAKTCENGCDGQMEDFITIPVAAQLKRKLEGMF